MKYCIRNDGLSHGHYEHKPDGFIEAVNPPVNSKLSDNWQTDPMNPDVCWRPKTTQELDAEKDADATAEISQNLLLIKTAVYFAAEKAGENITLPAVQDAAEARARQIYKALKKGQI